MAEGKATKKQWDAATQAALDAVDFADEENEATGANFDTDASCAAAAAAGPGPYDAAISAANARGAFPDGSRPNNDAYYRELIWQWRRLREYAEGTAKPLTKQTKVGGRSHTKIQSDPMATAAEIRAMAKKKPLEAVSHPNCPQDLWWKLASHHPYEALTNPAGVMFQLEDPGQWAAVERAYAGNWVSGYGDRLPGPEGRLFAADCAEHVLPIFTSFSGKGNPLRAIQAARAYVAGEISKEAMWSACRLAHADAETTGSDDDKSALGARAAAMAAAQCCNKMDDRFISSEATRQAARAAGHAAGVTVHSYGTSFSGQKYGAGYDDACIWMWHRLLDYLNGKAAPLPDVSKVGGRHHAKVQADPMATAAEIRAMAKKKPKEALAHPNCPTEIWWGLAKTFPYEALQSPAGAMFLLETPERWQTLEQENLKPWLTAYSFWDQFTGANNRLSEKDTRMFAVDCVEHVMPIYHRLRPTETLVQAALDTARSYAQGQILGSDLENAHVSLLPLQQKRVEETAPPRVKIPYYTVDSIIYAAYCATHSNNQAFAPSAAENAAFAFANEVTPGGCTSKTTKVFNANEAKEQTWQWHRLLEYLRGEAQPLTSVGGRKTARHAVGSKDNPDLAPFNLAEPGMAPSPKALRIILGISPRLKSQFKGLLALERLAEPDYQPLRMSWEDKVNLGGKLLTEQDQRLFAADCVEMLLSIWKARWPVDDLVPRMLQTARDFANGVLTESEVIVQDSMYQSERARLAERYRQETEKGGRGQTYNGTKWAQVEEAAAWALLFLPMERGGGGPGDALEPLGWTIKNEWQSSERQGPAIIRRWLDRLGDYLTGKAS